MFKMFTVILSLALLTPLSYSIPILDNVVCGKVTDALESNFFSLPDTLLEDLECSFELIVRPETCGIRLGFESFSFPQPLKLVDTAAHLCSSELDLLKLKVLGLPVLDVDVLCGDLAGQHINILVKDYDAPIEPLDVVKKLVLTVVNAPKLLGVQQSSWNITVTQLLCNQAVGPVVEEAKKIVHSLAPVGCLQYFVEKEGIIESLNFLNGLGHYLGNLNYAICFKRFPDTCGIKFTAIDFELATNGNSSHSTERDCDTLGLGLDVGLDLLAHQDYVVIPNGEGINATADLKLFGSKYCGKSLKLLDVSVKTKGPLYLAVVTDGQSDALKNLEVGFKIKYELLTCSLLG